MPRTPQRPSFAERVRRSLGALGAGPDAHVLVAVSGGCDSVALLHLLRFARADGADGVAPRVSAAHFDHAMRPGSAADAAWVRGLCRGWGVPLLEGRADPAPRGEEAARDARYAFLRRAQAECGATYLATAHHADDQAETVLFRVLRGTGIAGLAGIPPADATGLIRPLLPFPAARIRRYARENALRWRTDDSNALLEPARNRIRLELLPAAERHVARGARRSLVRLAQIAREDEAAWTAVVEPLLAALVHEEDGALVLVRERFTAYDWALRARLLRTLLRRLNAVPDRAGTRMALEFISHAPSGRVLQLAGGIRITTEFGQARVERAAAGTVDLPPDAPLRIEAAAPGEGRFVIGGQPGYARWTCGPADAAAGDDARTLHIALDRARLPLTLRGRAPGDRIRTRAGTRTLKKVLGEARVPLRARGALPVLADAGGAVLWIPGVARADGCAPTPGERALNLVLYEMPSTAEILARTGGKHLSKVLFSEEQIAARVRELGEQITRDIPEGEDVLVLGLLKGSFIFLSDLVREIRRPIEVDFLIVSSYGAGTDSSGEIQLLYARQASLEGKHVIIVEDIVDSGTTLNRLVPLLEKRGPRSLEICALLHKHIARDPVKEARWVGFDCPQEFVIGYGLDHSEKYRHLPFVGVIEP